MGLDMKEQKILMTEAALNPLNNKKRMCEIMFEKMGTGALQVGVQALLAIYAEVS